MKLHVDLRQLEHETVLIEGEVEADDLGLGELDELMRAGSPLSLEVEASLQLDSLLVRGRWSIVLDCECARCLRRFPIRLELSDWARLVPLEGEESLPRMRDQVDLTPLLREDILLELPQRPLCDPSCSGIPDGLPQTGGGAVNGPRAATSETLWSALNEWKMNELDRK